MAASSAKLAGMNTRIVREDELAEVAAVAEGGSGRTRLTRERQRELIAQWQQSGLSRAEFCRQRELCYGSFGNWMKREQEEAARCTGALMEVRLTEDAVANAMTGVELIAPNGWRVCLNENFEDARLMRLLKVVSRC
jgi:hypothetical protein